MQEKVIRCAESIVVKDIPDGVTTVGKQIKPVS